MKKIFIIILFTFISCQNQNTSNDDSNKHAEYDKHGNKTVDGYMIDGKKYGVWKYYQDNRLIEVKKFNNDTLQYILDKNDYDYEELFLEKINSYIPAPKSWEKITNVDDKVIIALIKNCEDTLYCPNILIGKEIVKTNIEEYINAFQNQLKNEYNDNLAIVELDKNQLSKSNSYKMKYIIKHNNIEIAFVMFWFKKDEEVISFNASCRKEDFSKYAMLFFEIGNSITPKNKN